LEERVRCIRHRLSMFRSGSPKERRYDQEQKGTVMGGDYV